MSAERIRRRYALLFSVCRGIQEISCFAAHAFAAGRARREIEIDIDGGKQL